MRGTFTEIYPIQEKHIPELTAYSLDLSGGEAKIIGGKLSFRLRKKFGGHWFFADYRIVTDSPVGIAHVDGVVEEAWGVQPEIYRHLRGLTLDTMWKPSPYAKAMFTKNMLSQSLGPTIRKILSDKCIDLGEIEIQRIHDVRPWIIQGKPAISVSVASRLKHKQDLNELLSKIDTPEEVIGLMVADKNTTLKREIFDISGTLKEHRERLLRITQTEVTVNLIENSPDDTLVVVLGREHYEYAATCLWPIVRSDDYKLFGVDAQKVNRHLRMHPKDRYELVGKISRLIRMQNLTGFEYSTNTHNNLFLTPRNIGFDKKVRLGNDVVVTYGKDIFYQLKKSGLYQYSKEFEEGSPIRIGVVKSQSIRNPKSLYKDLETELSDMKLDMGIVAEETLSEDSRIELEYCIDRLERHEPHLVLGVFDWGPSYHSFKLLTVGRGLASQVVLQKTLANKYAIPNIVLGIVGKTGNIPYVLEKPLPFADMIVGIDVAREKKRKLKGTVNVAAIARIYFSNGQFVKYVIHDEPIEGETIPVSVLQSLFPANEFKGRKVILHRDGSFRGDEENALKEWANNIDATIYPVEVIKSGAPRLYGAEEISPSPQGVDRPQVGMSFLVSSTEALLASSPPHDRNATPRPLRIRTKSSLSIRDALQSVMSLTILHCGSTIPPRLPVTVHYSDKIAGLALKGVKPKNLEGDRPYWY